LAILQDFEKWGNRVVKNLVYYQTNYFIMAGSIFTAFGLFHPFKIILGIAMLVGGTMAFFKLADDEKKRTAGATPGPNKYVVLGGIFVGCYFFLYIMDCVVIVTLSLLLPFCGEIVCRCKLWAITDK
jgi:PRA1 family protein 3